MKLTLLVLALGYGVQIANGQTSYDGITGEKPSGGRRLATNIPLAEGTELSNLNPVYSIDAYVKNTGTSGSTTYNLTLAIHTLFMGTPGDTALSLSTTVTLKAKQKSIVRFTMPTPWTPIYNQYYTAIEVTGGKKIQILLGPPPTVGSAFGGTYKFLDQNWDPISVNGNFMFRYNTTANP